ncbi:MAG: DUF1700 domain-containing protein [Christensenellales bacterium]
MNRNEFFRQLSGQLVKMPKEEKDDIIRDFEEYFQCAAKDGADEETICARLGDPKKIGKEFVVQKLIGDANREKSLKHMSMAFVSSAGLGVVNFLYVLFVVAVGYIVIASLYIAVCAAGVAALGVLVLTLMQFVAMGATATWLFAFGSICLLSLSALGFIGLMQLSKQFKKANMAFLNKISSSMKRRNGDE